MSICITDSQTGNEFALEFSDFLHTYFKFHLHCAEWVGNSSEFEHILEVNGLFDENTNRQAKSTIYLHTILNIFFLTFFSFLFFESHQSVASLEYKIE